MSDKSKKGVAALISLGFLALVVPTNVLMSGWAAMLLWNWYLVPVLGLPSLGFWMAAGMAGVLRYLTSYYPPAQPKSDDEDDDPIERALKLGGAALCRALFVPGFAILFGRLFLYLAGGG